MKTFTLPRSRFGLPEGTIIMRREYSWAIETPTNRGYRSCGVKLSDAIRHALSGEPERATAILAAQAKVMAPLLAGIFRRAA